LQLQKEKEENLDKVIDILAHAHDGDAERREMRERAQKQAAVVELNKFRREKVYNSLGASLPFILISYGFYAIFRKRKTNEAKQSPSKKARRSVPVLKKMPKIVYKRPRKGFNRRRGIWMICEATSYARW
jgi:hypothetical protein